MGERKPGVTHRGQSPIGCWRGLPMSSRRDRPSRRRDTTAAGTSKRGRIDRGAARVRAGAIRRLCARGAGGGSRPALRARPRSEARSRGRSGARRPIRRRRRSTAPRASHPCTKGTGRRFPRSSPSLHCMIARRRPARGGNGATVTDPPCSRSGVRLGAMSTHPSGDRNATLERVSRRARALVGTAQPHVDPTRPDVVTQRRARSRSCSTSPSPEHREPAVIDIGSGGGVPGIVIAILRPDLCG